MPSDFELRSLGNKYKTIQTIQKHRESVFQLVRIETCEKYLPGIKGENNNLDCIQEREFVSAFK